MLRLASIGVLALIGCADVFDLEALPELPACAMPDGHDEDGDRFDDACDLCPGDPGAESDEDRDGIGDACDPTPQTPGDQLVQFFSFASPGDIDHWAQRSEWTSDGEAFICDSLGITSSFLPLLDPPPALPFELQASVTINDADRTMYDQFAIQANNGAMGDVLQCVISHATSGTTHTESWTAQANATAGRSERAPLLTNTYAAGARYRLRMTFAPTSATCFIEGTRPGGEAFMAEATTSADQPTPGMIAVSVIHTAMRLEWLAIYTIPPP